MADSSDIDRRHMQRALGLAARGEGFVEPNPPVGCVVAQGERIVGEGFHQRFGDPHAEVVALEAAGDAARGATLYVTLEPCNHHGKTPPCTDAILTAGVARVVIALRDQNPDVAGGGIDRLVASGVVCDVGLLEQEARHLLAPYLKLMTTGHPWVIAKWAMTLDGKIATASGESRWISGPAAREMVHRLRGRMDAVIVGSGTILADDPLLTARPADPADLRRVATRVVVDSQATLPLGSQLVQTAREMPALAAVGAFVPEEKCRALTEAGVEVMAFDGASHMERADALLEALGARDATNVLVEGGATLLGTLVDLRAIDEIHVFIAPKIVGGNRASTAIAGRGIDHLQNALNLFDLKCEVLEGDVYVRGRIMK